MTKTANITRRTFLGMALASLPGLSFAQFIERESEQLMLKKMFLDGLAFQSRFIHFTDLHFTGKSLLIEDTIEQIRLQKPDFACFTGDLIEKPEYAAGAFAFIQALGCPVYGVPGNHDYRSGVSFAAYTKAFRATGGDWLENSSVVTKAGMVEIVGTTEPASVHTTDRLQAGLRILLTHYPAVVDLYEKQFFTVVLAGHSHGGQVRFPFYGPLYLPDGVGDYVMGQFKTRAGIMNVSAGLGTSMLPVRFNCRPEITLITT
jgi:uncharacterized protein